MTMTFEEACSRCPPGYYINSDKGDWREHNAQYGRDNEGKLFWTAGGTAGGYLTQAAIQEKSRTDGPRFNIYHWGSSSPVDRIPTFAEAYRDIHARSPETQAKALVNRIQAVTRGVVTQAVNSGTDPEVAELVVRNTIQAVLDVLGTKVDGRSVYVIQRNAYAASNIAPLLRDLFDQINN